MPRDDRSRFNVLFQAELRRLSETTGMTQVEIAARLGRTRHTIQAGIRLPKAIGIDVLRDFCALCEERVPEFGADEAADLRLAWFEERAFQPPLGRGFEWLMAEYLPTRLDPGELARVKSELLRRFEESS